MRIMSTGGSGKPSAPMRPPSPCTAYTAQTSSRIFVFSTGPGLILPQLERNIQNDILVTQTSVIEQATQQGLIADVSAASWRNPLAIAALRGGSALDQTLAVTDPTQASDVDGPAVLIKLGLKPRRVLGAVDSDEVAFLIPTDLRRQVCCT